MKMPILKLVQKLEGYAVESEKNGVLGFARTINEAITMLQEQGEKIVDLTESLQRLRKDKAELQCSLMAAESEREYHRSRADFFREVAEVGNQFIAVEGFKAFRGTMRITPKAAVPSFDLHGDWLYKPDTKCWYGKGSSFPEDICTIMEVFSERAYWTARGVTVKGYLQCSACNDAFIYEGWLKEGKWNYCPKCGARMKRTAQK